MITIMLLSIIIIIYLNLIFFQMSHIALALAVLKLLTVIVKYVSLAHNTESETQTTCS